MQNTVAKRYATALHQLAVERGITETIAHQLSTLAKLWQERPEWRRILLDPRTPVSAKGNLLRELATALDFQPILTDFTCFLLDKGRISALTAIAAEFVVLEDRRLGRVRAQCQVARPLTSAQTRQLVTKLKGITNANEVDLAVSTEPELLAGFIVNIEGKIIDGSLRGRLEQLKKRLARLEQDTER